MDVKATFGFGGVRLTGASIVDHTARLTSVITQAGSSGTACKCTRPGLGLVGPALQYPVTYGWALKLAAIQPRPERSRLHLLKARSNKNLITKMILSAALFVALVADAQDVPVRPVTPPVTVLPPSPPIPPPLLPPPPPPPELVKPELECETDRDENGQTKVYCRPK
jgi:hypothetical protein